MIIWRKDASVMGDLLLFCEARLASRRDLPDLRFLALRKIKNSGIPMNDHARCSIRGAQAPDVASFSSFHQTARGTHPLLLVE
jgi:hypothetical protein